MNKTLINSTLTPTSHTNVARGMVYMIIAMLLLPVGDTFVKLLTVTVNPIAVTMWRLLTQCLFLIPTAYFLRHRLRGAMFSPIVALSGLLLVVSLSSLIIAFSVMPIATAIAIFFVEPLILTLLAGPLLGEFAGPRRLIAVLVGLIGALIIIRPGFSEFGWVTVLPLLSAFAYALNMIILKRATVSRSALTMQCGSAIYGAAILVIVGTIMHLYGEDKLVPLITETWAWTYVLCAGAIAAISVILIAEAFRAVDATTLAPFQYLEIISATSLGFLIFGNFPDALTWVGVVIILGSGIYVFHREGQTQTAAPRRRRVSR